MKRIKQSFLMLTILVMAISCSSSSSGEPTLQGKWAFGSALPGCNKRNSIEFKNSNAFFEHHYNPDCVLTSYPGQYSKTEDIVIINGNENVILELTSYTLKLYQTNNSNTKTYDRVN